jgi:replicative DNA helicase
VNSSPDEEIPPPPEPDVEPDFEEPKAEDDRAIDLGPLLADRLLDYDRPIEVGATSGWRELDEVINGGRGLLNGQYVVVAGRPGAGKSMFLVEWLRRLAASGVATMLQSLEMSRDEIGDRILASSAGVRLSAITGHALEDFERQRLAQHARTLGDLPFRVSDNPMVGLGRLRSDLRAFRATQGEGMACLAVDYVQLMLASDPRTVRREQIDEFSRGLKILAKSEQIPVIANAQLNRGPEQRPDGKPQASDLRESGSLEQDPDIILLLWRPEMHPNELHVLVAKNRNGPANIVVRLSWQPALSRIGNLDYLHA